MEIQIAQILRIVKDQLSCCVYIIEYPNSHGKKNFDLNAPVDRFYKNTCNVNFYESLLLITNLLSKDRRTISFFNWSEYLSQREREINMIDEKFNKSGLKVIRDQVVGHVDSSNRNNRHPYMRRRGIINTYLVEEAVKIQDSLIDEFYSFTLNVNRKYSPDYFSSSEALNGIKTVMNLAVPTLTDDVII